MSSLKKYIGEFKSKKENRPFGVRFATGKDAEAISLIMKDAYSYEYLYPKVYKKDEMESSLERKDKNVTWGIAESIDELQEPAAICVTERRNNFSLRAGKTVVHNRFRGQGMGQELGINCLMTFLNMPENKNIVRLDSDVRTSQINSQKLAETAGSIAYGFIPNYNNYADKRAYDPLSGKPFVDGKKESVILYVAPIKHFWKIRSKFISLIDDPAVIDIYQTIKSQNRKMKKDEVTLVSPTNTRPFREKYEIEEDFYKGTVLIIGTMLETTIKKQLKKYQGWNVIEWRIPVIPNGVASQKYALRHKFVISGYDPGSYSLENGLLCDTLVMCSFPNGVELNQFECVELTKNNKFIASKVINQISKYYPACKDFL